MITARELIKYEYGMTESWVDVWIEMDTYRSAMDYWMYLVSMYTGRAFGIEKLPGTGFRHTHTLLFAMAA